LILGAIDISKRATRLKVAEVGTGDSVRLLERSSLVSAELSNCDRLSALLMAEIEAARDAGADHVEVVATRSLRGTRLLRLLDRVCRASGAGGILLPDPEQRLASTFLAATVPSAGELEGTVAVARVGESTTGIAVGAPGERPGWVGSRPVGCATLTEKARFSDPPRPNQIEAAVTAAVRKLETLSPPAADRVLLSTPLAAALERICGPRIDPASARRGLGSILGQTGGRAPGSRPRRGALLARGSGSDVRRLGPGDLMADGSGDKDPDRSSRQGIASVKVKAPTRGNRKLEKFLDAVNRDDQVRAWWYMAQTHAERLGMSDHSWVHMQIVLNIALRVSRLLTKGGVQPAMVTDHAMSVKDAEVVVAAGALLHDVGMSIHRADHEAYSLFLAREALERLLDDIYPEPERSIVIAEALHAIIGHRRRGQPYTVEAGIVRVSDALDMAQGRTRIPLEAGQEGIHSISAAAIDEVRISAGETRPVRIEIELNNSAGIFQVDDLLATKIRDTPLAEQVEVVAEVSGESEKRLLTGFRLPG